MAGKNVARKQGEGQAIWMLGGLYEVKVAADDTDGAMTVMEMTVPMGAAPPAHTHDGAETVYVLDGKMRYHIGDETFEGGPGSIFHIPEGAVEYFEPVGGTLRVLITYTPGGLDNFFMEAGEPTNKRELPPPSDTPPDLERIAAIGAKYGLHIQAPG